MQEDVLNNLIRLGLTVREAMLTECLLCGKSNIEIASELNISEKTVKFHLGNIYKKLKKQTRSEVMAYLMVPNPVLFQKKQPGPRESLNQLKTDIS